MSFIKHKSDLIKSNLYKLPRCCKLKCWSRVYAFCSVALRHTFHQRHQERDREAGPITEKQPWVIFHWYNHRNTAAAPHDRVMTHTHTHRPKGTYDPPLPQIPLLLTPIFIRLSLVPHVFFLSLHKVLLVRSTKLSVNIVITDVGYNNKNAGSGAQTSGHFLPVPFSSTLIVSSVCDSGPKILGVLWWANEQILAETPQLKGKHRHERGPSVC